MAYSKAYQEVIAGRVREDSSIAFFGQNKVATLSGTKSITNRGGIGPSPELMGTESMKTEYQGKSRPSDGGGVAEAYGAGSYQAG